MIDSKSSLLESDEIDGKLRAAWTLLLILTPLVSAYLYLPRPLLSSPHSWGGTDLRYYLAVYNSFWSGEISNPYAYADIRRSLAGAFGYAGTQVMPIAQTPSALFIFYPLLVINRFAPDWAELVFNWAGALLLSFALLDWTTQIKLRRSLALSFLRATIVIVALAAPAWFNFTYAQLSCYSAAAILLLLLLVQRSGVLAAFLASLLLLILSCKLPHLLIGALIVIASRNKLAIAQSCLSLLVLGVGVAWLMPWHTLLAWADSLSFFLNSEAQVFLPGGVNWLFTTSPNLRVILSQVIDPALSWRISSAIYMIANLTLFVSALLNTSRGALGRERFLVHSFLALAVYLFLSPYLPPHDLLLLIPALCCVGLYQRPLKGTTCMIGCAAVVLCAALFFRLSHLPWVCGSILFLALALLSYQYQPRSSLSQ